MRPNQNEHKNIFMALRTMREFTIIVKKVKKKERNKNKESAVNGIEVEDILEI